MFIHIDIVVVEIQPELVAVICLAVDDIVVVVGVVVSKNVVVVVGRPIFHSTCLVLELEF